MTDLGTEFGVEVRRDGTSEVHVLAGQVELATQSGSSRLRLVASSRNSAARVDAGRREIVRLPAASECFIRVMPTKGETPVVDWSWNQPEGFFVVAKDDLLQTSLASVRSDDPDPPLFFGQTLSALYDGTMYGPNNEGMNASTACSFSARDGKSVTFVLDTSVNKLGYTIDSIDLYAGYELAGVGQKYKVEFAQVGEEDWLRWPVVRFSRRALWDDRSREEARSHIHNRSPSMPLATHVNKIRFTFYDVNKLDKETLGTTVYREIDVFGSPTAPASASDEPRQEVQGKEASP